MTSTDISVSPKVGALLPDALIEYLWQLAPADGCRAESRTFILEPAELGGRGVQDIFHAGDRRRVFGIEPVTCMLRILHAGGRCQMVLAE